jgi:hypothetical protein
VDTTLHEIGGSPVFEGGRPSAAMALASTGPAHLVSGCLLGCDQVNGQHRRRRRTQARGPETFDHPSTGGGVDHRIRSPLGAGNPVRTRDCSSEDGAFVDPERRRDRMDRAIPHRTSSTLRCSKWPVTPEVAGSSPVAPALVTCLQTGAFCCPIRRGQRAHGAASGRHACRWSQTQKACKTAVLRLDPSHPRVGRSCRRPFRQRDLRARRSASAYESDCRRLRRLRLRAGRGGRGSPLRRRPARLHRMEKPVSPELRTAPSGVPARPPGRDRGG